MITAVKLSDRLRAVANMVTPGLVLADIGTDHAYIPIYLAEQKVIPRAIAADINEGPLLRARMHIRKHGLSDRIETRLSDGLTALQPGEAQSIVIAGMGGALTVRILKNAPSDYELAHPELILQPQSELSMVRAYLIQNGWSIVREDMVFEDGKYYPMMKAKRTDTSDRDGREYSPAELAFGPELLQMRHPVLHQYLIKERLTQERILGSLEKGQSEKAAARVADVRNQIGIIDDTLERYYLKND